MDPSISPLIQENLDSSDDVLVDVETMDIIEPQQKIIESEPKKKIFKSINVRGKKVIFYESKLDVYRHPKVISEKIKNSISDVSERVNYGYEVNEDESFNAINTSKYNAKQEINSLLEIEPSKSEISKSIDVDCTINLGDSNEHTELGGNTSVKILNNDQILNTDQPLDNSENSQFLNGKVQTKLFGFFAKPKIPSDTSTKLEKDSQDSNKLKAQLSKDAFKDRIRPFYIKPNTTVANLNAPYDIEKIDYFSNKIDEHIKQNGSSDLITIPELLKTYKHCNNSKKKTENIVNLIADDSPGILFKPKLDGNEFEVNIIEDEPQDILGNGCDKKLHFKLIYFSESRRPCFYGTLSKKVTFVSGRRPFKKEPNTGVIDYDIDSEEEWDLLDEEGEELKSEDDEEEEEDEDFDEDAEIENEWIVNVSKENEQNSSESESSDSEDSDFDANNPKHIKPEIHSDSGVDNLSNSDGLSDIETMTIDMNEEIEIPKNNLFLNESEKTYIKPKRKLTNYNKSSDSISKASKNDSMTTKNQRKPITKLIPVIIGPIFPKPESTLSTNLNLDPGNVTSNNINTNIISSQQQILSKFPVVYFPRIKPKPIPVCDSSLSKKIVESVSTQTTELIVHTSPLGLRVLDNATKEKRNKSKVFRWYVKDSFLSGKKAAKKPQSKPTVSVIDLDEISSGENQVSDETSKKHNGRQRPAGDNGTGSSGMAKDGISESNQIKKEKSGQGVAPLLAFFQKL
ncbi:hypothetical protein AYI70_g652 [Smittium culicis]|uniref:Chromatin assembly factor 1 subunit A dimerization domain-containing protein n=1 Tax=Smittium culicis TaxID=133412 RepID=A0A1R1YG61_9FUNG|nr:hypothetical protein AYI70_g652 [Smittium culicis]